MRQYTLALLITYLMLVSIGCVEGGGGETASTDTGKSPSPTAPVTSPVATPSPSPAPAPAPSPAPAPAPSHAGEYLLGTWQDQTDSAQVWRFNNDGTGSNDKCAHTFTWPKESQWSTLSSFTITDVQPGLLINGCKPLTGNYPLSRTCTLLKFSSTSMRFECNFQGQNHTFNKVP